MAAIYERILFSYMVTIVYFPPHVTGRMTGPVTRTNGVGPRRIKDSVADNSFRGGVSLGGHRRALYPLSLLSGTPPASASYLLFSVLFSFPSFLSVVIFLLFFADRIFFFSVFLSASLQHPVFPTCMHTATI